MKMKRFCLVLLLFFPIFSILSSNWSSIVAEGKPQSKLGRQGENTVKQFVVPGFDDLPLDRKLFVFHLSQAIDAGRDIYWQQVSPEGLAIRALFEKLWAYRDLYDGKTKAAIEEYLFRLYKNKSNYEIQKNSKFTLKLSRRAFRNAELLKLKKITKPEE